MAKIIISFYSGFFLEKRWQVAGYYEALINELKKQGNHVLVIISNDFVFPPWNGENVLKRGINDKQLKDAIQAFEPDLVIAFNNATLKELDSWVDCPFVLWDADSWVYFCDKERVKKNKDRYTFFAYSEYGYQEYIKELSPKPNKVHLVKSATSLSNQGKPKQNNIAFIGSYFECHPSLNQFLMNELDYIKIVLNNKSADNNDYYDSIGHELKKKYGLTKGMLRGLYSGSNRNQTVAAIAPLGLSLFGTLSWLNIAAFSIEAIRAFDFRIVYTLAHLEHIYNHAKIGINISHTQNVTGYPWRVLDIMASGACLVSDYKSDLEKDFKNKVDIPFYNTPFEAYKTCESLLNNESRRLEIVEQSNQAIKDGFLWSQRIKEIEQICGVSLCNATQTGQVDVLNPEDFFNVWLNRFFRSFYHVFEKLNHPRLIRTMMLINNTFLPMSKLLPPNIRSELHHMLLCNSVLPEKYRKSGLPIYQPE